MRVLVLHNRYRRYGGEDAVAESEVRLLRANGIEVLHVESDNDVSDHAKLHGGLALAMESNWSKVSYDGVRALCREFRPDVAHVHNFWLRLTPAVHAACREEGVPTVQTLHNFRLFCVNAQFQRNGHKCEDCLGHSPWRGVALRCYRNSFLASAAVARMIMSNRARDTWRKHVSAFIALSRHSRKLFIAGGIPQELIHIKPNFIEDTGTGRVRPSASRRFVFVGRLSPEKGVRELLDAWARSGVEHGAELAIAGDGPERARLEAQAARLGIADRVTFLGHQTHDEVMALVGEARAVVLPSLFHECFPRVLVEAMSAGRPILASSVGALDELVGADIGVQFPALDPAALGAAIRRFHDEPALADRLGAGAREAYLARYTPERNFEMLMRIYEAAMGCESGETVHAMAGGAA
jgi:glycosyltransferase involved in cell wall biosynthesis